MCLKWFPYFSLYQAPWRSLPDTPSFPGFFMGRLFAFRYPSDTFVKLPVSEIKCIVFVLSTFLCTLWKILHVCETLKLSLDPQGWEKGVVFINGLNLGRYWSIGPQQALYLPGPFLNSGINQVQLSTNQQFFGKYPLLFCWELDKKIDTTLMYALA